MSSSSEALKVFLGVLAAILGIPTLIVVVKAGMFFGSLSRAVNGLEKSLSEGMQAVGRVLEKIVDDVDEQRTELGDLKSRVSVLEDRDR